MMSIKRRIVIFLFPLFSCMQLKKPKVFSIARTMDGLKAGKSLARFGDGELQAMTENIDNSFQSNNHELAIDLKRAMKANNPKLMIAVSTPFSFDFSDLNDPCRQYWKPLLVRNWHKWNKIFSLKKYYYNAFITRPYFDFYECVKRSRIKYIFDQFKLLFLDKKILIVEGEFTRFGVADDLLVGCKKVYRIIGPAQNAFSKKDKIESAIRDFLKTHNIDLILLSLGQTATILACNLIDLNIQVIDIGHLDVEYNWFLQSAKEKIPLQGKWVNEAKPKFSEYAHNYILIEYNKQVIEQVK